MSDDTMRRLRESADARQSLTQKWMADNPGEIPYEWEEEAETMGLDMSDDAHRAMVLDMLATDDDALGDWDRYQ